MLNSILIENFKSYKSQRLPLAPLTLMIGANASGKTNAIEAFRFLSWVVGGEKLSTIKNRINDSERIFRGDVRDLVYQGEETFTLGADVGGEWDDYQLTFKPNINGLEIWHESLKSKTKNEVMLEVVDFGKDGTQLPAFYNHSSSRKNSKTPNHLSSFNNQRTALSQIQLIPTQNDLFADEYNQITYSEVAPARQNIENTLGNVFFFDLIPSAMRGESYPEIQLRNTGANLAGVLYTLWLQNSKQAHILEFIQSLPEQDIKALKFYEDHRGRVELALIETFGHQDQEQSIELLSDGTLRVLAIAAALLSAPEGSTVVIEEVDNGVHPSRAKQLLTTMREHAERRNLRLLLSTHNPALMDALPDEALGDVVFCYRDPNDGDSRLVRLSDLDDYMGLVMQGSLGQLVTRGIVDRFVKNPVTPEEKKQKALDWLAMMQGDDE
jgi:predicted ATPase